VPNLSLPRSVGGHFHFIRAALRLSLPLAWAAIAFAVVELVVSFTGADLLGGSLVNGGANGGATHPLTGLCLIALAGCVLRTNRFALSSAMRIGVLAAILSVCIARLMDWRLSRTTGSVSGSLFGPAAGFGGEFSVQAAIILAAFAAAALVRQGNGRLGSAFLVIGIGTVFTVLLGIGFGVTFYGGSIGGFALLSMGCASLAMVSVYINRPFVRAAFLLGDVGSQTRVMAGLVALEVAMIAFITVSMLVILMTTSAGHEGTVAARHRAEREIAMQSRTDTATGALNRFGMTEVVEGAWVEFKSAGAHFGLILIDLDHFRRLDATFGHDDAEAVLSRVVQTVQPQLRASDALGRWGADEFLVLLKIKDHANVGIVADRISTALADARNPFCAGLTMEPTAINAPFGISTMNDSDGAPTDAITRANDTLHLAKMAGEMLKDAQKANVGVTGPLPGHESTTQRHETPDVAAA
jgi:diguanylate cyclase (GGDEF)-like protein